MTGHEIQTRVERCEADEKAIVIELLKRLDTGREQYGPWDVMNDERDYLQEALEEILDALLYIAAALVRLQRS